TLDRIEQDTDERPGTGLVQTRFCVFCALGTMWTSELEGTPNLLRLQRTRRTARPRARCGRWSLLYRCSLPDMLISPRASLRRRARTTRPLPAKLGWCRSSPGAKFDTRC